MWSKPSAFIIAVLLLTDASRVLGAAGRLPSSRKLGTCLLQFGASSRQTSREPSKESSEKAPKSDHTPKDEAKAASAEDTPASVPLAVTVQQTAMDGAVHVFTGPTWKVLLELHVPVRLLQLHSGSLGPIKKFLSMLSQELCAAGPLSKSRLVMLDVRGENQNLTLNALELTAFNLLVISANTQQSSRGTPQSLGAKETIVDMEVLPMEHPEDLPALEVLSRWQAELADENSELRQGPLADVMQGATLVRVGPLQAGAAGNEWGTLVRSRAWGLFSLCGSQGLWWALIAFLWLLPAN
mmetsp:Transcript_73297/g.170016  ORF Transcript_73297/g.170016 Transcript_73297/m.170016 type:complete len:297 (+) Transcript_73297:164-1054(+)